MIGGYLLQSLITAFIYINVINSIKSVELLQEIFNETTVPSKTQDSTQDIYQESISPSLISSLFINLNNNDPNHVSDTNHILSKPSNVKPKVSKFSQTHRPELKGQSTDTRPMALGMELMEQSGQAPGNLLVPGESTSLLVQPSSVYDRPVSSVLPMRSNSAHVIANLYVDQLGNQQLVGMQPSYSVSSSIPQVRQSQQQYSNPESHGSHPVPYNIGNFYNLDHPQPNHLSIGSNLDHDIQNQNDAVGVSPKKRVKNNKSRLSNEQLMALIDELKEFNIKEASKGVSGSVEAPRESDLFKRVAEELKETNDSGDNKHEDEEDDRVDTEEAKPSIQQKELDKSDKPTRSLDMDSKDLDKFARFLMSKEGKNMKFQLGLDKDHSPDDGDEEDERDVLLETNARLTQTRPEGSRKLPGRELVKLESDQENAKNNFDKLLDDMVEKVAKIDKLAETKRHKVDDDEKESINDSLVDENSPGQEESESRFDRTQQSGDTERNKTTRKPTKETRGKNIAKLLIEQEMLQDELDSDKPESRSPNLTQNDSKLIPTRISKQRRSSENKLDPLDAPVTKNRVTGGEATYRYPAKDRNRDHIALIHELQKSRATKSKLRSRIPISSSPLTTRALNGELGVRAEKQPDGDLLFRSNKDALLTLRLPHQSNEEARSEPRQLDYGSNTLPKTEETKHNDGSNFDDIDESGDKDSLTAPNSKSNISFKSASPLKDEYPVSERVSERLNKLSKNLDRYFNDGFLQEIETKAKNGRSNRANNLHDTHQTDSSNKLSKTSKPNESRKKKRTLVDHDFDVDVGVDGKRDTGGDELDDENDSDEPTNGDQDRNRKGKGESLKHKKLGDKRRSKRKLASIKNRAGKYKVDSRGNKQGGDHVDAISLADRLEIEPNENESRGGSVKTVLAAARDNLEFENQANIMPNLDPIDNETLETPIGPDRDNIGPNVDAAGAATSGVDGKRVERSRTQDKLTARYGKKPKGKFFEEPEWS